jgi:Fe-Mn family superoxide dismutase
MAFSVPDLPYAYDALEPHISEETMRFHHDKHHQAYVDKANAALDGTPFEEARAEDLLLSLGELPDDLRDRVRDNVGGHVNHSLFWTSMKPEGGGQPGGKLLGAIKGAFGNFKVFKDTMRGAAASVFGSGWVWLVDDGTRVFIVTTTNQDSPVSDGLTPLVGLDLWEHAYYLQYENRRPEYVDAWLEVVDWAAVEARYDAITRQDVSDILLRTVSIAGVETVFGEIDKESAKKQAAELKALQGWGPMAKVGSIARAWGELANTLDKRDAVTVSELDATTIITAATDLWVIPPGRGMV